MLIVPNDYCPPCKADRDLIVSSSDEHSIYAKCPVCSSKHDLIFIPNRIKEVKDVNTLDRLTEQYAHNVSIDAGGNITWLV